MDNQKEGFTITCNKCGSKDVSMRGVDGGSVYIYCNDCDNEEDR